MKINKKLLIAVCIILAALTLLCSCAVNTSSTDTKYKYVMIGTLSDTEEQTVNGAVWRAIKAYQKKSIDETTNDKLPTIKYYTPAGAAGTDSKSYAEAFTEAAKKQLELAASGGAEIIILPSDAYAGAYEAVKDNSKNFGNVNFIILTVPGSSVSNVVALNGKTTAVVIDVRQYGYVFGYVLTASGFSSIGYVGAEGKTSDGFITGVKAGCKDAAAAKSLTEPTIATKIVTTGPSASVIADNANALAAECDVLIGDEMTQSAVAEAAEKADKKYASIFADEKAEMTFSLNCDVLTEKLASTITECRQRSNGYVMTFGVSDGIFVLRSGLSDSDASALLSTVPDIGSDAE